MNAANDRRDPLRQRWAWMVAALALLAVATTVVGLVRPSDDDSPDGGEVSSSALPIERATGSSDSPSITSTPATTTVITTTVPTTSTSVDGASTTSAPPVGATPNSVSRLSAGSGGGSGEVVVRWATVLGAIGYRVLHAATVHGPFSVAADVNVQTGETSAVEGVTNIWSDRWTYHPPALASSTFDGIPDELEYVELITGPGGTRYFRVIAYNAAGASADSSTVCAVPPGGAPCWTVKATRAGARRRPVPRDRDAPNHHRMRRDLGALGVLTAPNTARAATRPASTRERPFACVP